MNISKEKLRKIVLEELNTEVKETVMEQLCKDLRLFLNEAKKYNSDIEKTEKFKMLEKILNSGNKQ